MTDTTMSLGELVDFGLASIPMPDIPDLPQHLQPLETKEPHMTQRLISLELALAAMEDAAATGDYQKAKDAARIALKSGLMKHGGPSLALLLIARNGATDTKEMRNACDLIKDSLGSLQQVDR